MYINIVEWKKYSLLYNSPFHWEVFPADPEILSTKIITKIGEDYILTKVSISEILSRFVWRFVFLSFLKMFSVPVKAEWQAARRNGKTLLTPDSMQFRINSKQEKKIFLKCFEGRMDVLWLRLLTRKVTWSQG